MDKQDVEKDCDATQDVSTIVDKYLEEKVEPRNCNPLLYWKSHKDTSTSYNSSTSIPYLSSFNSSF